MTKRLAIIATITALSICAMIASTGWRYLPNEDMFYYTDGEQIYLIRQSADLNPGSIEVGILQLKPNENEFPAGIESVILQKMWRDFESSGPVFCKQYTPEPTLVGPRLETLTRPADIFTIDLTTTRCSKKHYLALMDFHNTGKVPRPDLSVLFK